jgi:hypothetical protein
MMTLLSLRPHIDAAPELTPRRTSYRSSEVDRYGAATTQNGLAQIARGHLMFEIYRRLRDLSKSTYLFWGKDSLLCYLFWGRDSLLWVAAMYASVGSLGVRARGSARLHRVRTVAGKKASCRLQMEPKLRWQ